ncbi:MAG: DmsC/YnfH family molybdoenzyme membrane anchor subunit, partial [Lautropia sp.]
MNPAMSVVFFTTLAGVGQGVVMAIALSALAGVTLSASLVVSGLAVSVALLLIALGASFLHLGRPGRAWRAVMMWRTSWLSREVIVLPAFIAVVALWLGMHLWQGPGPLRDIALPLAAIALCLLLWYCTAMIYACIRFIQEWAHPLTLVNYTLIGLSSGLVLFTALCWLNNDATLVRPAAAWALFFTVLAALARIAAIVRNVRLKPMSTLHSATGVKTAPLRQKSMGMTGGSFNTREFMHGKTLAFLSG